MKRERPPMPPIAVRVAVARRQLEERWIRPSPSSPDFTNCYGRLSSTKELRLLLEDLFGEAEVALDHDPALILRHYNPWVHDVAARYTPHAHDPAALIYREKSDHQQKTTGRKPGASRTITTKGSDIGLKTKFARLEKPRKPRTTIVPRGFAKVKRKIQSRPFPSRKA